MADDVKNAAQAMKAKLNRFNMKQIVLTAYYSKPIDNAVVDVIDKYGHIWHITSDYKELICMRSSWCHKNQDWLCHLTELPIVAIGFSEHIASSSREDCGARFKAYLADDDDLAHVFDWLSESSKSGTDIGLGQLTTNKAGKFAYIPHFWQSADTIESILIEADLHIDRKIL